MRDLTFREAVREALREEMKRDPKVFMMGEEIAEYGGSYKVSQGLLEEFGHERIRNTPLAEAAIAGAALEAGSDWLVLTNTISGAAIDIDTKRPLLHRGIGGYSGPPLKPIAIRCVLEVRAAFPSAPIVGCGGVRTGGDVVEFLLAGASAVAIGTLLVALLATVLLLSGRLAAVTAGGRAGRPGRRADDGAAPSP